MRNFAVTLLILALQSNWSLLAGEQATQPPLGSVSNTVPKVSVFFGTNQVMGIEALRTNAVALLQAKGYKVPVSAQCVVNVVTEGPLAGCAVLFFDMANRTHYEVDFNARGQVTQAWGGPIRHYTVGPNDPLPQVPEGAVRVR
jgi:hypothetical protein